MTGGRGVFRDGQVGMFAICMLMEPGAERSSHLTNIVHVTVILQCITPHTIYPSWICLWG